MGYLQDLSTLTGRLHGMSISEVPSYFYSPVITDVFRGVKAYKKLQIFAKIFKILQKKRQKFQKISK